MSRAQFDREEVVMKSAQLFWQRGLNGASMQQVFECTGLKPGSVYLAFGSKEALYRESLAHYTQSVLTYISETLDSASSVGEGLCRILKQVAEDSSREDFYSCFLVKSQLELTDEHVDLRIFTNDQFSQIEALYTSYLEREYGAEEASVRASSIMVHILGARVYGYHQRSFERVITTLKLGLPWLPWGEISL